MASEKQITWATKIRSVKLDEVQKLLEFQTTEEKRVLLQHARELLERRTAEIHASFWIDKRSYPADVLASYAINRERRIADCRSVVSGEKEILSFNEKMLGEFLNLIDERVVKADRTHRTAIYDAMCALIKARTLKEKTVVELKRRRETDYGKNHWSQEWYADITTQIEVAENKPIQEYL